MKTSLLLCRRARNSTCAGTEMYASLIAHRFGLQRGVSHILVTAHLVIRALMQLSITALSNQIQVYNIMIAWFHFICCCCRVVVVVVVVIVVFLVDDCFDNVNIIESVAVDPAFLNVHPGIP